jgi:hypothetical protein
MKIHFQFQQIQIPSLQYSTKDIKEIESRVLRVIGEYDKISSAKVNIDAFVASGSAGKLHT